MFLQDEDQILNWRTSFLSSTFDRLKEKMNAITKKIIFIINHGHFIPMNQTYI